MKVAILGPLVVLASCASSPEREVKKQVEAEFLSCIGKRITWSPQVEVLEYESRNPVDLVKVEDVPPDFDRQDYFVSYEYDPLCVDWYAVFASCDERGCDYWFARTGGICE